MLNWFGACHRAGRLTVGFDTWIEALDVAADAAALTARLRHTGAAHHAPAIIAVLAPGEYTVTWQGEIVPVVERYPGTLEIQLPQGPWVGGLRITQA